MSEIGPFTVIDPNVVLPENIKIHSHVVIHQYTSIGAETEVFTGAVLGGVPQDLKFEGEESEVIIGQRVKIREYVTVNRGTKAFGKTMIGDDSLIMAYSHVAHDCIIGNSVVISNAVQMAGHVEIGTGAVIGGMTAIHQFVRIGRYAMVSGGSLVRQDVPPFIKVAHEPLRFLCVNRLGLERAGWSENEIIHVENAYRLIFGGQLPRKKVLEQLKTENSAAIKEIVDFIESSSRGIIKGYFDED